MADGALEHERTVKGALRKGLLAEPFLASRYSFSPYMACGHGCAYCDGRAERYWVEGDFERDVVVRTNVVERLDEELGRLRERAPVSVGSGISDAYQPVEARRGLMRRAAEALRRRRFPASVLTKSALAARDLDVWSALNAEAGFTLSVSLVFADDEPRRIFEPGASPVDERLAALAAFKAAGCGTGVYAMPLLPWISDTPAALERLLARCREVGADFVRPGRQKEFFLERLARSFPDLVARYRDLYAEERPSGSPRASYSRELGARLSKALNAAGLVTEIPHRLYRDRMPLYDELYLLLCHMVGLYGRRGTDVRGLESALAGYRGWLTERKREFNRRRRQRPEEVEEELRSGLASGRFEPLAGNAKLGAFLRRVAIDRRVFDYATLTLL